MTEQVISLQRVSSPFSKIRAFWTLIKPGIVSVTLVTTASSFLLASKTLPLRFDPWLLFHTLFGTALVAMGAGSLNMLSEKESDAIMERTKNRPIPAGRISCAESFLIGSLSAALGIVHLAAKVNLATSFLASLSLTLYLVFYTPLKKKTPYCLLVGAVSGALPPMIGWSGVEGFPSLAGWSLFLVLFFWQMPHLSALSWLYREDYEKVNFKMSWPEDSHGNTGAAIAFFFSLSLLPVSLLPYWAGITHSWSAIPLSIGLNFFLVVASY
ncbi:MAG: protoheme IX farnesyltransferase, partial [Elusimicrobia bacterium]|nr:protoheme IX farnesyltransferase [Elusimicrobiota bacterium]